MSRKRVADSRGDRVQMYSAMRVTEHHGTNCSIPVNTAGMKQCGVRLATHRDW
jgi:hypothetical protein